MAAKQHETQRHLKQSDGEADNFSSTPSCNVLENLTLKRSKQNLAKHKRLKTYPGAISQGADDDGKENEHHKRSSSQYARSQYENMILYNRLRESKQTAENAIKVCCGVCHE